MTMNSVPDQSLKAPLDKLSQIDSAIASNYAKYGLPPTRSIEPSFAGLTNMIISQQVSVKSAAAIWKRLCGLIECVDAKGVLQLGDEGLICAGLSKPKRKYVLGLAEEVECGSLDLSSLKDLSDAEVIRQLTAIKGIGRWTSDIYLLLALNREDVMPAGDLALQEAYKLLHGLPTRPTEKELRELTLSWSPCRSAGARFLWYYYKEL